MHSVVVNLSTNADAGAFSGRHRTWDLGTMVLQTIQTDGVQFASLNEHARQGPVDHWVITLFLKGDCNIRRRDTVLKTRPGVPQITSLATPFRGHITRSEVCLLYIPRDTCRDAAYMLDAASFSSLQHGMGGVFADYMQSLEQRMPQMQRVDLPELASSTRSLLLAAVASSPRRLEEVETMINYVLIERAKRCIHDHLQSPPARRSLYIEGTGDFSIQTISTI
ncbi:hypothetical protein [Devosia sp. 1566]|uniref:AraC-like ligand-binding domain-containing protein n=1 Tax=Devosia sp. 1566 TaxID=2499144 RepID=UPI0024A75BF9|nr:hypothetical protein [Devosia sp. 1566]